MINLLRSNESPRPDLVYMVKTLECTLPNITYTDCPNLLTKKGRDELYDLMKIVHDIFTKHGIKYFVQGGTLLGCVRHQGAIPWDDDIDISVLGTEENCKKINRCKRGLLKKGYMLLNCAPGFAIQNILFPRVSLDVFFLDKRNQNSYYELSYPYKIVEDVRTPQYMVQELWPWGKYPVDLDNLILMPFYDYHVYVPKNYSEIISITYKGKDCLGSAKYSSSQSAHLTRYFRPLQSTCELIASATLKKETYVGLVKTVFS